MSPFSYDPSVYYLIKNGKLNGLSKKFVDYIIGANDVNLWQAFNLTSKRFELEETEELLAEFTRFTVDRDKNKDVWTNQGPYLSKRECLPLDYSFKSPLFMH